MGKINLAYLLVLLRARNSMETHRVGRGQELRACGHSAYPRGPCPDGGFWTDFGVASCHTDTYRGKYGGHGASLVAQMVKNLPAMQETRL